MNAKPIVTVLAGDRPVIGLEKLQEHAELRITDIEGLEAALSGAEVLYLWDFFAEGLQDVWHSVDALKWIHVPAAGVDKLLFPELVESDVVVTNARGIFDRPMAEFVLGGILHAAKGFGLAGERQRRQQWESWPTTEVAGARVLVAGTGSIGRCTARLLRAVGMEVDGLGRTARTGDPDFGTVHASADFAQVAGEYDYVVLAAPLTTATERMASRTVLEAMKPSAVLINVGRGRLVDQDALVQALCTGRLGGAVLDVFETEPLPQSHALWQLDNVLVTPHMSGDSQNWLDELAAQFESNFHAWRQGKPMANVVDKRLGFVPRDH
ncbi:D-2-hydroxyacid dehydrogenase [Crystallibacter degradans]|uniref:D-2-hydroxyacid dehydrogenase n=1 Tax=Crystallibacter degradans TaxID=2726743 RepID=UPI001475D6C3|nr:D-2-hydroxyacid dehydrogenase [Arthrobacter sp. SF27]NMR28525.1 D-2-hydroxyacid dehydrogenase [Arthrobacter sp. SF27]